MNTMNTMNKSSLSVDGNSMHISMPFAKVDEKRRTVSGWATLDNMDTQGDVVLAEASAKAFARARGNIREMHQPLAVGRMIDFREDEFFDSAANEGKGAFYRGIYVTARVSEGAEDTWKKVLDGTLTGFSIGGEINDYSNEFVKDAGTTVRFIKDYDLVELSLVDNPANQLANMVSIQKNKDGGTVVKGMAVETKIENVFACSNHDEPLFSVNAEETASCPVCEGGMESIGWFETNVDKTEKVNDIVTRFLSKNKEDAPISGEGGVDMADENNEEVDEAVETEVEETEEVESPDEVESEETEEDGDEDAESPEEVVDEESKISKKIDELHEAVKNSLEESKEETLAKVSELESKVEAAKDEFLAKASELEEKINGFGEKVEAQKNRLSELESNLEKMNRSDAFRKSADMESTVPIVQKETFWGGAFSD